MVMNSKEVPKSIKTRAI